MRLLLTATLGAVAILSAADEQRIALGLKAQTEFSRVETGHAPGLVETQACVQAQAALLPVAGRDESAIIHYRKGFCSLAGASLTGNSAEFTDAAVELEKAIADWPAHAAADKTHVLQPVPSSLRMLASMAKLMAGVDDTTAQRAEEQMLSAAAAEQCSAGVLQPASCQKVIAIGHQWLGWLAIRREDAPAAARELASAEASGWTAWASGKKSFRDRQYAQAAEEYRRALATWEAAKQRPANAWIDRLGPPVDLQAGYRELGSAELLAGHAQAAIESLNKAIAVKDQSPAARLLYLRARAKELAGQQEAALADYSLASRTAFAAVGGTSGEAHLYRGIMFYRRNDFPHAEDEFSSALNFEIATPLRADASAWRQLAAVAAGSCGASRDHLEQALPAVSPYFPKEEARSRLWTCATAVSARRGL